MKLTNHFFPGALGPIAYLHGSYYAKPWGLTTFFEAMVARESTSFA
jgi:hypothetical protein